MDGEVGHTGMQQEMREYIDTGYPEVLQPGEEMLFQSEPQSKSQTKQE